MNKQDILKLRHRDVLIHTVTGKRWYVNGAVKLWKTRPNEFKLPVKHGLYAYGYVTHENSIEFELER